MGGYFRILAAIPGFFLSSLFLMLLWNANIEKFFPVANNEEKLLLRRELALPEAKPLALFVGAIIERKGVLELLRSWVGVQNELPSAELVLVGPRV